MFCFALSYYSHINDYRLSSLAELAILNTARSNVPPLQSNERPDSPMQFQNEGESEEESCKEEEKKRKLRGILPSLRYVASQQMNAYQKAEDCQGQADAPVSIAARPNSHENPQIYPLDAFGDSDFFCRLCHKELSNVYMHCDGCEKLLSKDFNICVDCHSEGRYQDMMQVRSENVFSHCHDAI